VEEIENEVAAVATIGKLTSVGRRRRRRAVGRKKGGERNREWLARVEMGEREIL